MVLSLTLSLPAVLIQFALAAAKSKKAPCFAIKCQRLVKRWGRKKDIIAIARIMLTRIHHMLRRKRISVRLIMTPKIQVIDSHFQSCRRSRHKQFMNWCKSRNDLDFLRLGTKRECLHTLFPTLEKLHSFHTSKHAAIGGTNNL